MLKYRKIDTSCPEYPECERIWSDSFPAKERPDEDKFRSNVDSNPQFTLLAILYVSDIPVEKVPTAACPIGCNDDAGQGDVYQGDACQDNVKVVGLMTWWDFGDFIYGEHFALSSELRGNGLGSRAFCEITASFDKPFVFEVEAPSSDNPIAERRIKFYGRCGMILSDLPYFQPPYRVGDAPIPMCLMTSDASFPIGKAKEVIYRQVYGL